MEKLQKKSRKLASLVLTVMMLVLAFGNVNVFAATVGEQLLQPEAGWKRYDGSIPTLFKFSSGWYDHPPHVAYFNSTGRLTSTNGSFVSFIFKGSKLRLLAHLHSSRTANAKIEIDNETFFFSQKAGSLSQAVTFEKLNLINTTHTVKVTLMDSDILEIDAIDIDATGELLDPHTPINPTLDVRSTTNKVKVGQEFETDIILKNVTNIYAEDFKITYDTTRFEYLGATAQVGFKVYHESEPSAGTLRYIVASQGQANGITGEKAILKLKFKAKAVGEGKVDAIKCRIADTTQEIDLEEVNCLETTIIVEGIKDVNRDGEFTLLDLAINGFYFGGQVPDPVTTNLDADLDGNNAIDDVDLSIIVDEILKNTNYIPNI